MNVDFENCRYIISKFCPNAQAINWGKEIKIARKLLAKFPDITFWETLESDRPHAGTLSWFLTPEGNEQISRRYSVRDRVFITNDNPIPLEREKVGLDAIIANKPSLMEFIS
jgi:hypothetical protein